MLKVAGVSQMEQLADLVLRFVSETPYATFKSDRAKIEDVIFTTINNPDGLVLVSMDEDKVTGILIATANEALFSRERWASELAWYVLPEYRSLKLTSAMIATYEYWAKKVNCQGAILAQLANRDLTKLYSRKGYHKTEVAFFKEITP